MKNKSKRAEGYDFVEDKQCETQLFESQKKFVLTGMNIRELESLIETLGEKKFRAKQVQQWIYKGVTEFSQMKNLPKTFLRKLESKSKISSCTIEAVRTSKNDGTKKFLIKLQDDNYIESVFMKYRYGNTICISSQSGCRMGCRFCASTMSGLMRNLSYGEMLEQVLTVENYTGEKINHIVVMGMGEPFDNYQNLTKFIEIVNSKEGLNIGMRNITVSTCGIIPRILNFAEDFPQVNLAISLHATGQNERSAIMPVNDKYKIDELIAACKIYIKKTNRRITFEYALVKDQNDTKQSVENLKKMLKGILCHVNLIPLNYVGEIDMKGSTRKDAERICRELNDSGIKATVRRELGADISGACGQLKLAKKS